MTAHAAKTAALIALAEGLLSDDGQRRISKHVAKCEICRRELAAIRAYEDMAEQTRRAQPPELDFAKMQVALQREAERVSGAIHREKRRSPYYAWGGLALAAVALLALYTAWPDDQPAPVVRYPVAPVEEAASIAPAYLAAIVTLAAGDAQKLGDDTIALQPGDALREGDRLGTGENGVLHVQLAEGTGFVAEARTELTLSQAREGAIELALDRGRVSQTVRHGSRYVILAAGYSVEVRGTRFAVSYLDEVVGVDVSEGTVVVRTPDGREIELVAPASWRSRGSVSSAGEVLAPRASSEGTTLELSHPELVRWEVDGTRIDTTAAVRLRVSEGEHRVQGWDARDRAFVAVLPVGRDPVFVHEGQLQPEGPRLRQGHLETADIQRVVQSAMPRFRQCYERASRESTPRLRLMIHVGLLGEVRRAQVLSDQPVPDILRACILARANAMTFPPPGGSVPPIEVPLRFTGHQ